MLRRAKYLIPIGVGVAVMNPTIVFAKDENANPVRTVKRTPWDVYCEPPNAKGNEGACQTKESATAKDLEKCISKCRQSLEPAKNEFTEYLNQAYSYGQSVATAVTDQVKYLQTCASDEVRIGAIAGGGLVGFLLGIRKNFFKKLVYAAFTGTGTAAIIYPKEAKLISKEGYVYARAAAKDLYAQVKGG